MENLFLAIFIVAEIFLIPWAARMGRKHAIENSGLFGHRKWFKK